MPPCLDIYIAIADRSSDCIEYFLAHYADLSTDRLRRDYAVFVPDIMDEVATGTLADTLGYGLADPNRSFALYFTSKQPRYNHVMVYFGHQGRLLLGLSIEFEEAGHSTQKLAEALLDRLCADYNTEVGIYGFELAPADAEERLYQLLL
jgi:hypothetical protein